MVQKKLNKDFLDIDLTIKNFEQKDQTQQKFYNMTEQKFNLEKRSNLEHFLSTMLDNTEEISVATEKIIDKRLEGYLLDSEVDYIPSIFELDSEELENIIEQKIKEIISHLVSRAIRRNTEEFEKFYEGYTEKEREELLNSQNIESITSEVINLIYYEIKETTKSMKEDLNNEIAMKWADFLIPNLIEGLEESYQEMLEELNEELGEINEELEEIAGCNELIKRKVVLEKEIQNNKSRLAEIEKFKKSC